MKKSIAKIVFGSKLYGTDIPTSDNDYRNIVLPDIRDCVLGKLGNAVVDLSEKKDNDTTTFTLQHFCRLLAEGQNIAIELVAAKGDKLLETSPIWEEIIANRKKFYTKNMHSFLGYAREMAVKYSARAERLQEVEKIINCLKNIDPYTTIGGVWSSLPETTNVTKTVSLYTKAKDNRIYLVFGRQIPANASIEYAYNIVYKIYESSGERVRNAKNGIVEWKSFAHAFRAALQCKEIVETGDLNFPLRDAEWLRNLRLGKIDFFENELDKKLDALILEVTGKLKNSNLPEVADIKFLENIIFQAYNI